MDAPQKAVFKKYIYGQKASWIREGFKKKKKSMEFSILSKTHPPHSPSMEKKNKNNMV